MDKAQQIATKTLEKYSKFKELLPENSAHVFFVRNKTFVLQIEYF